MSNDNALAYGPGVADLEALRVLAEAATPGPWEAEPDYPGSDCWRLLGRASYYDGLTNIFSGDTEGGATCDEADALYIAAANPATVLALVAEVERLRAELGGAAAPATIVLDRFCAPVTCPNCRTENMVEVVVPESVKDAMRDATEAVREAHAPG